MPAPPVALPLVATPPMPPAEPAPPEPTPPAPPVPVAVPPVAAPPTPPVAVPPLALPELLATLPMFCTVLPDTVPVSALVAVAVDVLKELARLEVAVAPLLAAAEPAAVACAWPRLLLLLLAWLLLRFELLSWVAVE